MRDMSCRESKSIILFSMDDTVVVLAMPFSHSIKALALKHLCIFMHLDEIKDFCLFNILY